MTVLPLPFLGEYMVTGQEHVTEKVYDCFASEIMLISSLVSAQDYSQITDKRQITKKIPNYVLT